ncbi:hypothetical protein ACFLYF_01350 [Chloroflexota bacterium]
MVQLGANVIPNDNILYQARVTDPTRWDPFEDSFEAIVLSAEPHQKGGDTKKPDTGTNEGERGNTCQICWLYQKYTT